MKSSPEDLVMTVDNKIPAYFVSLTGKPKFYTICSMLFEAAAIHAGISRFGYEEMMQKNIYWVLSRFQIRMEEYPSMDQPVRIVTWPKGINKLFFMRDYKMTDIKGKQLASATSAWLILDLKTGRPKMADETSELHNYSVDGLHAIEDVPGKLPSVIDPVHTYKRMARYSDLDINKHVNAAKYIEWIQDIYPYEQYIKKTIKELQINYQSETRYGEEIEIRVSVENENGYQNIEGYNSSNNSNAFRAKLLFSNP